MSQDNSLLILSPEEFRKIRKAQKMNEAVEQVTIPRDEYLRVKKLLDDAR